MKSRIFKLSRHSIAIESTVRALYIRIPSTDQQYMLGGYAWAYIYDRAISGMAKKGVFTLDSDAPSNHYIDKVEFI